MFCLSFLFQSHVVVAFTFVDTVQENLQLHVPAHASADIKQFLQTKCNQRYVCLNNTAGSSENNKQMKHLFEVIQEVVFMNDGKSIFITFSIYMYFKSIKGTNCLEKACEIAQV